MGFTLYCKFITVYTRALHAKVHTPLIVLRYWRSIAIDVNVKAGGLPAPHIFKTNYFLKRISLSCMGDSVSYLCVCEITIIMISSSKYFSRFNFTLPDIKCS